MKYEIIKGLIAHLRDDEIAGAWNHLREAEEYIYNRAEFDRHLAEWFKNNTPLEILTAAGDENVDWFAGWFRDGDWQGLLSANNPKELLDEDDLIYSIIEAYEADDEDIKDLLVAAMDRYVADVFKKEEEVA